MKKHVIFLAALFFFSNFLMSQVITTFNYTGALQTYVVPPGVTSIDVDVIGAEGGDAIGNAVGWANGPVNVDGGNGGRITATMTVIPGETLNIYVGGEGTLTAGGFNGGGNPAVCAGGTEVIWAGGGGGSDIRQGGIGIADRVIVAGGGGGASGSANAGYITVNDAGAGGGTTGANSQISGSGPCLIGLGGSQIAGGAGGNNGCWCSLADIGGVGTLGAGGSSICVPSGLSTCSCSGTGCVSGGGGGGGYYGGGAGLSFAGGGGGSSYADPSAINVVHTQGYQTGNGQVIITVICTPLVTSVSSTTVCFGELITLSATSAGTGIISWDNGVADAVPFLPATTGIITYTALSSDGTDCSFAVDITVLDAPQFSLATSDEFGGNDGGVYMTITSGIFPFTYDWDNDGTGDFDDPQNLTNVGPGTYTVVVSQGNGCTTTDSATVSSQLGIQSNNSTVLIYPNPVSDNLSIEYNGEFTFAISDLSGRVLLKGNGADKKIISLDAIAAGTYLIYLSGNNGINTIQLVKQ